MVGGVTSRFFFRKFVFCFIGAINIILIDLFPFLFSFLWVRFFNLIARAAGWVKRPREPVFANSIFASPELSISFQSTYLVLRFIFSGFVFSISSPGQRGIWASWRFVFREFVLRLDGAIGFISLGPLLESLLKTSLPGPRGRLSRPRFTFSKLVFCLIGAIHFIPSDLFHFRLAFLWVRFSMRQAERVRRSGFPGAFLRRSPGRFRP